MTETITQKSGMFRKRVPVYAYRYEQPQPLVIHTLEGDMTAMPGDWVITGVNGEQYPCKPDIFAATYEPANSFSFLQPPS
jgi:hypothetical protein